MSESESCLACFCCLPCILFMFAFSLAVPSFLMFVGITNMDNCQIDSNIPIWMICVASLIFIQTIFESVRPIKDRSMKSIDCSINCCSIFSLLLYFSRIALFAATIVGCVLVFSAIPNRVQCDGLLYWTAFIYCIISLILYSIASCFWICCCCLIFIGAYQTVLTEIDDDDFNN